MLVTPAASSFHSIYLRRHNWNRKNDPLRMMGNALLVFLSHPLHHRHRINYGVCELPRRVATFTGGNGIPVFQTALTSNVSTAG